MWLALALALALCGRCAAQDEVEVPLGMEMLEDFRKSYDEARETYYRSKINLAAALLDVANKQGEVSQWTAMYKEAQLLSRQVLAIFPDNDSAQANLKAATNSLKFRMQQAGVQAAEDDEALVRAIVVQDDDDDEDDDDADQEGDSDGPPRASMSYSEALQRAQQGTADREVLGVFRNELARAQAGGNAEAVKVLKINLAALIIDTAKSEKEHSVWESMYAECIQLSEEVLEHSPGDDSAKANKQAAQAWLDHRRQHAKQQLEAEFLSVMAEPSSGQAPAPPPPSDGLTEAERARRALLGDDDDDDDDDEKDEL
jgi:hypothetical protein